MTGLDRPAALTAFIARAGWADAAVSPLAGDASNRRYLRLRRRDGKTAVVMDAPPEKGEDIRPFLRIAGHLRQGGLRAPATVAADPETGMLILEDLGDTLFARVLTRHPNLEAQLYSAAPDLLAHLHTLPLPTGIAAYDPATMADLGALAIDWYAPDTRDRTALELPLRDALSVHAPQTSTLALRDYHAENLIWLSGQNGPAAVGLLDFQDAMAAHPGYDLVSLLTDARRDVSPEIAVQMRHRFLEATGQDPQTFEAAFATLSAQRNLRILGVFARLCLRDAKPSYLGLIPRVWGHLQDALAHPALSAVADAAKCLPPPDAEHLSRLEAACGTRPSP